MRTLNHFSLSLAAAALITIGAASTAPITFADCGPQYPVGCRETPGLGASTQVSADQANWGAPTSAVLDVVRQLLARFPF